MDFSQQNIFKKLWDQLAGEIYQTAVDHGFWEAPNDGERIALMHSELSEALEALRHKNPPSKKAQGYSNLEEELADVVIRIMDYAQHNNLDIAGAIFAKHQHNTGRPFKHGKEF